MDSGNSGSLQSSSGGDEEYDSRAESMSAFFNSTTGGAASFPNLAPPPPTSHHHPPPFYDTLSYLDSNPNPLLNFDMPWARSLRPSPSSNPNCTDIGSLIASSSSLVPTAPLARPYSGGFSINLPPVQQLGPGPDQPTISDTGPRSSKKRSRASRRAPTTVLTTDTTNFRAMVQEFTGIPAPPFASSSPFPRSRFDLFHSTLRSSTLADTQSPYLLRPFAQKVQASSYGSTTSSSTTTTNPTSSSNANANANAYISMTTATNPTTSTTNNYKLPSSDLGLGNQHQTLLNIQNPNLTFQSYLQSPLTPEYYFSTMPAVKSQAPLIPPQGNYGARGHLGLGSLVASEGMHSMRRGEVPSGWADGSGPAEVCVDQAQLTPVGGNYETSQRVSSCKLNFSADSSSNFHSEKGSESLPARGEGMVDSWICSSD